MAFADLVAAMDDAARAHLGGVTVAYKPEVGAAVNVEGIFDENYKQAQPGESSVEQIVPAVWLTLADLPKHPREDNPRLTINGVKYKVRERQTDSQGTVMLVLLRAGGD